MNPLRQYLASCLAEREPKRKAYHILCLQMQKGRNKNDDDDSNNKNDEKKWVIGHISSASAFLREKSFHAGTKNASVLIASDPGESR